MAWNWKNYLWGSALYYGLVWGLYGGKRASLTEMQLSENPLAAKPGTSAYDERRKGHFEKVLYTPGQNK